MKKITFGKQPEPMQSLLNACSEFLKKHGYYGQSLDSVLQIDGDSIRFNPECANDDYTQAIGLFCLLFTRDNKYGYLSFHGGMKINTREMETDVENLTRYITSHTDITIEY